MSLCLLFVGSQAAASSSIDMPNAGSKMSPVRPALPPTMATILPILPLKTNIPGRPTHTLARGKVRSDGSIAREPLQELLPPNAVLTQPQPAPASNSQTTTTTMEVQLAPTQTSCQQGSQTVNVPSAQVMLDTPTTADGTLTWYWEWQLTSDSSPSGAAPISDTQNSQSITAGTTQVTLTADDPSQPLLGAPASADYAYILRLHVAIGSTIATSAWITVPQADATTCQQD